MFGCPAAARRGSLGAAMGSNVRVRMWRNEAGILLSRDAQRPGSGVGWFWGEVLRRDLIVEPGRCASRLTGGRCLEMFGDVWMPDRCATRLNAARQWGRMFASGCG